MSGIDERTTPLFYGRVVSVPDEKKAHLEAVMARIGVHGVWEPSVRGVAPYQDGGATSGPVVEWTLTLPTEEQANALLAEI